MPREAAARQPLCADFDGFSLQAAVRIEADERKRLEQLCRYITRPALSDQRVQLNSTGQVELRLKTLWRDGTPHLVMSPLDLMQRLTAIVPRPRLHLIRWIVRVTSLRVLSGPPLREHCLLASNAKLRRLVVPHAPQVQERATEAAAAPECEIETVQAWPQRISWSRLLKRLFEISMRICPNCGGRELKLIATVQERP